MVDGGRMNQSEEDWNTNYKSIELSKPGLANHKKCVENREEIEKETMNKSNQNLKATEVTKATKILMLQW